MRWQILLVLIVAACNYADGAKILGLWHFFGKSHFFMFESLMKGLAARGHEVTVVSHFPQKKPIPNYKDIDLTGATETAVNLYGIDKLRHMDFLAYLKFFWVDSVQMCEKDLEHPNIRKLLQSNEKYDLLVMEVFDIDCMLGFAHKFKAPVIMMSSSNIMPWANDRFGNPDNPSYIPNLFVSPWSKLNFYQRTLNTIMTTFMKYGHYLVAEQGTNKMMKRQFGEDWPTVAELNNYVSLMLVNTHFSIYATRPLVPNIIEVAGLHIQEPKELPKDLKMFMDGAKEGVILFTFGSVVQGESLSKDKLEAFVKVFSEIPQRVVWKCDRAKMPKLPSNIYTDTWLPQYDILSHPKTVAFISHGGAGGLTEAIYNGVPMVGIPIFAEQDLNVEKASGLGMAYRVDYDDITEDTVRTSLKAVLKDPSYRNNAQELSRRFRDRPMTALDTAIFWTEYVIRHQGAPHLRSAAADMPLYQYLLLDILGLFLLIDIVLLLVMYVVVKKAYNAICGKKCANVIPKSSKKKKQ